MYLYRYDSSFNIIRQDTLATLTSGNPLHNSLICYDSSFYMAGLYFTPTLSLNSFSLINPNAGLSYPGDIFVYKWGNFGVLPLSFLSFDAGQKESRILLRWNTANEMNTDKFIIERSNDGIHFKDIATVKAYNTVISIYEYADDISTWPAEFIYYRLKQTDHDAHYAYLKYEK